jgi:RNA polymerase sigma-70 factor (ECF subfamily)
MDLNLESKYLKRLGEGSHEAFDILFVAYHPLVVRFLSGFIKNSEDVRDISQNIFYNIWLHKATVSKLDSFKAYLFKTARNAIYNHFKLNAIRNEHLQQYQRRAILIDDLQEERLLADELGLLLDIVIDQMPPQRKQIFMLSRKNGLSNDEIAQRLSITRQTVENHITKALADLRKALKIIIPFFI